MGSDMHSKRDSKLAQSACQNNGADNGIAVQSPDIEGSNHSARSSQDQSVPQIHPNIKVAAVVIITFLLSYFACYILAMLYFPCASPITTERNIFTF